MTHPTDLSVDIDSVMPVIVEHCEDTRISSNPVEVLRYMQTQLVRGRALDVTNVGECEMGDTSYILVDRNEILETSFEEIEAISNRFLTSEVQFYGEVSYRNRCAVMQTCRGAGVQMCRSEDMKICRYVDM